MWGYFRTHPLCTLDEASLKSKSEKENQRTFTIIAQLCLQFSSPVGEVRIA